MKNLKIYIIAAILLIATIIGLFVVQNFVKKRVNDAAIVNEIRALNRWETSSYSIEKIIDSGSTGNIFQKVLFGNRILLIAHGEVVGGFDLSKLSDSDVKTNGTAIAINLPAPQILSTRLDETQTRVYDRQKGVLVETDNNLETEARIKAVDAIYKAACTQGILDISTENAKKQLTSLLSSFGFTSVTVNIPQGKC